MGSLKDENDHKYERLILEKTKLLPSLDNIVWEKLAEETQLEELPSELKLFFKRAAVNVEIIKTESDPSSKYEMFQRLNTLGTALSDQEVRNCLLIMINRDMFLWLEELAKNPNYLEVLSLTDRSLDERYEMELVLRAFTLRHEVFDEGWKKKEVEEILTDAMVKIATDPGFDFAGSKDQFEKTFQFINSKLGDQAFKRFNVSKNRFEGPFNVSAFECVCTGTLTNIEAILADQNYDLENKVKQMWQSNDFVSNVSRGTRATTRIDGLIPFGKRHFQP